MERLRLSLRRRSWQRRRLWPAPHPAMLGKYPMACPATFYWCTAIIGRVSAEAVAGIVTIGMESAVIVANGAAKVVVLTLASG